MNREEFVNLAMAIKTYYPKDELFPNEQALSLWFHELTDIEYECANVALRAWVRKEHWPPTIADIRSGAEKEHRRRFYEKFEVNRIGGGRKCLK